MTTYINPYTPQQSTVVRVLVCYKKLCSVETCYKTYLIESKWEKDKILDHSATLNHHPVICVYSIQYMCVASELFFVSQAACGNLWPSLPQSVFHTRAVKNVISLYRVSKVMYLFVMGDIFIKCLNMRVVITEFSCACLSDPSHTTCGDPGTPLFGNQNNSQGYQVWICGHTRNWIHARNNNWFMTLSICTKDKK